MLDQNRQENIKKLSLKDFSDLALGVPFADRGQDSFGWNCWGLIVRAYRECFGIELEVFEEISGLNRHEAGRLFAAHRRAWISVQASQAGPGDVILFQRTPLDWHAALVVKAGLMLHVDANFATCVEPYTSGPWKTRLEGFYRHVQLAGSD